MQKWLDDIDIWKYSTHNEGKSVVAERLLRTCKAKIYKKLIVNDKISYLDYLNKWVDKCNNNYSSIGKKPIDTKYSVLTGEIESNLKAFKFKAGDRVRITKSKNIFSKGYTCNFFQSLDVQN